jgi:hypothetical protein
MDQGLFSMPSIKAISMPALFALKKIRPQKKIIALFEAYFGLLA